MPLPSQLLVAFVDADTLGLVLNDPLFVPPLISLISLLSFAVSLLSATVPQDASKSSQHGSPQGPQNPEHLVQACLQDAKVDEAMHNKRRILAFNIARTVGSYALLLLSTQALFSETISRSQAIGVSFTYFCAALFATSAVFRTGERIPPATYCNAILLSTWVIYLWRDIWPLATYMKRPSDVLDFLFWAQMTTLTVVGVLIPLCIPRQYVPVDPHRPAEPHPEQTASAISLALYSFMSPVVHAAAKVPHLSHEALPPLADYDHADYLVKNGFKHLVQSNTDKKRHIFFNVVRTFRWDFTVMCLSSVFQSAASFIAPVAVNRLLLHLETEGHSAIVNPWIWILGIFMGPMATSITFQWYVFVATRAIARAETLFVQLVFDRSLQIRLKADTENSNPSEGAPEPGTEEGTSGTVNQNNLIGKINTLITVDLENIVVAKDVPHHAIHIVASTALGVLFLYSLLGWSSFVGCATIIILMPVPGYLATWMQSVQEEKMKKTDARVEAVSEAIGVLRMIKLFGWEGRMNKNLEEKRREELAWIWKSKVLQLVLNVINFFIPVVTIVTTFATYTVVQKQSLTASKLFSSIAAFEIIRGCLHRVSLVTGPAFQGKVSLERIQSFLEDTELLDRYDQDQAGCLNQAAPSSPPNESIGFNDAAFTWSKDSQNPSATPSGRHFRLRVEGEVLFKENAFNLVVGPTGSGKTAVLLALLGEMHFTPPSPNSWYNLPRSGGVAYAAQESWVQNETIRNNILFGSPYDEERYQKVIHQCALARDLELFDAGDATEVGEKGLTLSGGQKARITLARAVYSHASVVLLDDVLAALDVHTSKWVVEKCFSGDLLKGRTVILVTHNVALTNPIADFVIAVTKDGRIQAVGSDAAAAIARDPELTKEFEKEKNILDADKEIVDGDIQDPVKNGSNDGKLILAEEIAEGRLRWKTLRLFVFNLSARPLLFLFIWMIGLGLMHSGDSGAIWFLGYWGNQYESRPSDEVGVAFYLGIYAAILTASCLIYTLSQVFFYTGSMRASRVIHSELLRSVLSSPLRWLDETPAARILTRATGDIAGVDGQVAAEFDSFVEGIICTLAKLAGPIILNPIFLVPAAVVCWMGTSISSMYLKARVSMRREQSNAKAPVLSHFGAVMAGLVSVRAYGAQEALRRTSFDRLDHYVKISRTSSNLNRWISIRIDALGAIFTATISAYLLVRRNTSAANTGFTLNMCLVVCQLILWVVRVYNDLEVECNKLERIQAYLDIEHEPEPTPRGVPPASWPTSGTLVVENLSARYSITGPKALRSLSFAVKSGERIGIVGRTGSGKTSLTLALLRCIPTEGVVYLDGLPISQMNLDALRSAITIIPQMPELLSGTLRRNLDPFEEHDDVTLNNALRSAGLFELQNETDEARITLDSVVSSGGGNFSVGQRQIIALARAMVRNSKLLILDEATSAIDHKTDTVIQTTLRNELGSDVTVLTIAHRLQTVMDVDKVMVLDAGSIVEFGPPQQLLRKSTSHFKAMVDGSDDRDALRSMASGKAGGSRAQND